MLPRRRLWLTAAAIAGVLTAAAIMALPGPQSGRHEPAPSAEIRHRVGAFDVVSGKGLGLARGAGLSVSILTPSPSFGPHNRGAVVDRLGRAGIDYIDSTPQT